MTSTQNLADTYGKHALVHQGTKPLGANEIKLQFTYTARIELNDRQTTLYIDMLDGSNAKDLFRFMTESNQLVDFMIEILRCLISVPAASFVSTYRIQVS